MSNAHPAEPLPARSRDLLRALTSALEILCSATSETVGRAAASAPRPRVAASPPPTPAHAFRATFGGGLVSVLNAGRAGVSVATSARTDDLRFDAPIRKRFPIRQ